MTWTRLVGASLLGVALAFPPTGEVAAQSVLREVTGSVSSTVNVEVNGAVVLEADRPFAELSVANPSIADIATLGERTIYVLGKTPGRTTLTILGEDGELITNVDVRVGPDLAEFKERLREILPNEPIEVRTASNGIVLSGRVSGARKLSRAIELAERYAPGAVTNLMSVGGTQQVMLKVRFAEMSRQVSKSLDTNLGFSFGTDNSSITAFGGDGLELGLLTEVGSDDPAQLIFAPENQLGLGGVFGIGNFQINVLIEALESKGLVRTLAEPNLVAISGEQATFLAGGEVGIPIQTNDTTTVEFKEFGVRLNFVPFVIDDDLIRLDLETEVSSLEETTGGIQFVTLSSRRASTSVEMRDGQSLAIAGLLRDDFTDSVAQIPWFGDIPVLGSLFRSTSFLREQSELVILITPYLVAATDGDALALPSDRVRLPSELDLFLNGSVEGSRVVRDIARQDFSGSYGYVME
ncbi:MAG: type II and III secretion system protein family protein [Pseudomonadota bacterium]